MRGRRPVFVGDVQGCVAELEELVARAERVFGDAWELWLVGDLVNRGPHSLRTLRRVRELAERGRARCVLGNHEVRLLRVAAGQRPLTARDSFGEVLRAADADSWVEWLRRLPLLEAGVLGGRPFAMVHAAVHPDWDLAELKRRARGAESRLGGASRAAAERLLAGDPDADVDLATLLRVTCCRSVGDGDAWSAEPPGAPGGAPRPWHEAWAERGHDYGVVYGHWSVQGLHVAPGLRGLDTGCVHRGLGGAGVLTAWVPDPDDGAAFSLPDARFWSAPARRAYALREADAAGDWGEESH
jgi:bis(5'-nucleosyl)-tetraphosphatase (symmetrical)